MKDYYQVLEIPDDASPEGVKEKWRFLVQAWHPDKFPTSAHKALAEEKIKQINEAYEVLGNPAKRAQYDRQRAALRLYRKADGQKASEQGQATHTHEKERQPPPEPYPFSRTTQKQSIGAGCGVVIPIVGLILVSYILSVVCRNYSRQSSNVTQGPEQVQATIMPSRTLVTITPATTATRSLTHGVSIGSVEYQIPPGWCLADKSKDDTGLEIHNLVSFCEFTRLPLATIDIWEFGSQPQSSKDAINKHLKGFESVGFQVLDLKWLESYESANSLTVTAAYAETYLPDHDASSKPMLLMSFNINGEYYIVQGELMEEATEEKMTYLYDTMTGIIESISSN